MEFTHWGGGLIADGAESHHENRRARHGYLLKILWSGIVLSGTEVKSLRLGRETLMTVMPGSREKKFFSIIATSVRMILAIVLTMIRCVPENCCCIKQRSGVYMGKLKRKV